MPKVIICKTKILAPIILIFKEPPTEKMRVSIAFIPEVAFQGKAPPWWM